MATSTLTPLGIAVTALLCERPMHPYEMYQLLVQRKEDRLLKIRPGSLYHTVSRLADDAHVESIGTDRDGNRPERTTYRITDSGRESLRHSLSELLAEPVEEYPKFTLALSESHNLDPDTVVTLLTERVTRLQKDVDDLAVIDAVGKERGIPRLFFVGLEYTVAVRTAEIAWLTGLVDEIASGALPWDPFAPHTGHDGHPDTTCATTENETRTLS